MEEPASITLGQNDGSFIRIPLRYLTRHGLIAGTTGTGKSRAMQLLAEQLSDSGVSAFVSDVKGDASGFCAEGIGPESSPKIAERNKLAPFKPHAIKTNYWSISDRFARMRFSLDDSGSVLLSRLLSLNPTQESHLALAFLYARKQKKPLKDLNELLDVLGEMREKQERGVSGSSISVIERKILSLEDSGLFELFGEPSVELSDLAGLNVLNLSDSRKDMIASIAPAFLINKLFNELPEVGDVEIPSMVIFFDEAHYLFKDANKSLKDLMVTILKQIRSKGVGVFFVTQDVSDLPEEILSQLSTKIIFSQKAATEKGNSRLKALARSFPGSDQSIAETLKSLPPGEAVLSSLDKSGNQTNAQRVVMFAPATTMAVVPDDMLRKATDPKLIDRYRKAVHRNKTASTAIKSTLAAPRIEQALKKTGSPTFGRETERAADREAGHITDRILEKKTAKKSGPSIWDGIFAFLLKLLDFLIKALQKIATALAVNPLKSLFRYLTKKPIRILYFIAVLIIIYAIIVNWQLISSFLAKLKIS